MENCGSRISEFLWRRFVSAPNSRPYQFLIQPSEVARLSSASRAPKIEGWIIAAAAIVALDVE